MAPLLGSPVPMPMPVDPGFTVSHQRVDLNVDLLTRSLSGRTEITLNPLSIDSRTFKLNLRQCTLDCLDFNNGETAASVKYDDRYQQAHLPYKTNIHQCHRLYKRLNKSYIEPEEYDSDDEETRKVDPAVEDQHMAKADEPELIIKLPSRFKIKALDPASEETQSFLLAKSLGSNKRGSDASAAELAQGPSISADSSARFAPVSLYIEFSIDRIRDGMQFAGLEEGDLRYPHAYSLNSSGPDGSRCLFPCVDNINARCTWELSVRTARTIGDIFKAAPGMPRFAKGVKDTYAPGGRKKLATIIGASFSPEDRAMELVVLSSGEITDEVICPKDSSKKITSFTCSKEVSAKYIGFVIGALEEVDLSVFRSSDEDDRLGQSAIPVQAFCTPGRAEEVKNTCFPIIQAIDYNVIPFGSFPYTHYKLCFVDECPSDVLHSSTLSICHSKLLFPAELLDPIDLVTRTLVHALATQWFGIDIVPKAPEDTWVIFGLAYFMTEAFLKDLFGRNEYRHRQKLAVDKVVELDVDRPSLFDLGRFLDLHPTQVEFMALKAPLVLFILDQRILKSGQTAGVSRIINRLLLNAKTGEMDENALDTSNFIKTCDRLSHLKLDSFFNQWVYGSGCPRFNVTQRFNKKKLVVEMTIKQVQTSGPKDKLLDPATFIRDMREDANEVYAGALQTCFTGPMTIRIHEADGTPYEHIVQINQPVQTIEVPYNTKYKRIKRNRKEKQRVVKDDDADYDGDETGEALLYSLGDILQSEEDTKAWKLKDWEEEDEKKMSNESYEWIRMDADFEWICKMRIGMPGYMYISQLQQDRDVVAQYESVQYLEGIQPPGNALIATFLTRTLMDTRYFHGVRSAAAAGLSTHARESNKYMALFQLEKAFKELYCYPNSSMTRPNDFTDRAAYLIQCAIAKAFGTVRDDHSRSPFQARRWLLDKLKYNDNSHNEFSDSHYVALLMDALASAISSRRPFEEMEDLDDPGEDDIVFHDACLAELERYRRSDEWTSSYSNIVSSTALTCRAKLIKSRFIKFEPLDFLQYTSDLTSPSLRTEALSHLLSIARAENSQILKYYLFVLGTDPSPTVREALLQHFFLILSRIAIGIDSPSTTSSNVETRVGDLVVETDVTTEAHKKEFDRKHSIKDALRALKTEIGPNQAVQEGIWGAITSPVISLNQIEQLLEIAIKIFVPKREIMEVTLKRPRYWSVRKTGRGKVRFTQDGSFRTQPLAPRVRPLANPPPKQKLKLSFGPKSAGAASSMPPTPAATTPAPLTPDKSTIIATLARRESSTGGPRSILKPPKPPPGTKPVVERQGSTSSVGSAEGAAPKKLILKFGAAKAGSPS